MGRGTERRTEITKTDANNTQTPKGQGEHAKGW